MYSLVTTRAAPSAPSRVMVIGVGHREAIGDQLPSANLARYVNGRLQFL